jgi:hypothetical protein
VTSREEIEDYLDQFGPMPDELRHRLGRLLHHEEAART